MTQYNIKVTFQWNASSKQHAEVVVEEYLKGKGVWRDDKHLPIISIEAEKV